MSDSMRVKLGPDEMAERAQQLAQAVRGVALLEDEQRDEKQAMAQALKAARKHMHDLADVVRTGIEDRTAQLGLFPGQPTPPPDDRPREETP